MVVSYVLTYYKSADPYDNQPIFPLSLVVRNVSVSAILYCDVWLLLVPLLCIIEK